MDKPEKRVWIAQCLCPDRHCIMAAANEASSEKEAEALKTQLHQAVTAALQSNALNPWCGICDAKKATWKYEVGRTPYRSLDEAKPHMAAVEFANALAREAFGDLHKKGKPH